MLCVACTGSSRAGQPARGQWLCRACVTGDQGPAHCPLVPPPPPSAPSQPSSRPPCSRHLTQRRTAGNSRRDSFFAQWCPSTPHPHAPLHTQAAPPGALLHVPRARRRRAAGVNLRCRQLRARRGARAEAQVADAQSSNGPRGLWRPRWLGNRSVPWLLTAAAVSPAALAVARAQSPQPPPTGHAMWCSREAVLCASAVRYAA